MTRILAIVAGMPAFLAFSSFEATEPLDNYSATPKGLSRYLAALVHRRYRFLARPLPDSRTMVGHGHRKKPEGERAVTCFRCRTLPPKSTRLG